MKFGLYLEENLVNEWKDFYINYNVLKILIKVFETRYKMKIHNKTLAEKTLNGSYPSLSDMERPSILSSTEKLWDLTPDDEKAIMEKFQQQMILELKKVAFFFGENLKYYENRLRKIKEQLDYIKINKHFKGLKDNLEIALKEFFKELLLMKGFVELNLKAKTKIMKKFKKFAKTSNNKEYVDFIEREVNSFITESVLNEPLKVLADLQAEIEKVFLNNFFDKYSFSANKVLKDYGNQSYFTQLQSFYFGFFVGLLFILLLLCLLIAYHFRIDMDDDAEFKTIFPMFRGYVIFCIYFWYLGLNVYAWSNAHINYKLAFGFRTHYSDVISIFKRAAFFSMVFVLILLCYMIIRTRIPIISDLVNWIPLELTPLICWLVLIVYAFCPFKIFNHPGRCFTLMLFIESMASIVLKCEFKHVWFTDQLTSMVGPLRDIEYTTCYYAHYTSTFEEKKRLCSNRRFIVLVIAVFPHFIRVLQCIRVIIDTNKIFPSIINSGKYMFNIIVAISSYYASTYSFLDHVWWLFALISTIYSYSWDIKMDFGFLQMGENYPLRDKLSYKKKAFYYFCIVTNFFLRFMWVLTVSPDIVYKFIRPEFFLLIIYLMEVLRRGMWNFIRVELKHIDLCKEFKVCQDVELPLKKTEKGDFVLRNAPLVDLKHINKRMNKIRKTQQIMTRKDTRGNTITSSERPSIQSNAQTEPRVTKYGKEYDNGDFRRNLDNYLDKYITNVNQITQNSRRRFTQFV